MTSSAGGISPWATGSRRLRGLAPVVLGRAMFQAHVPMSVAFLGTAVCVAGLTAAFVYASGAAIGAIPDAVRQGPASPALRRVEVAVASMAAIFVVQQLLAGVQDDLAQSLARRMEGTLRTRVFRALSKPRSLTHLDDPHVQQRVSAATTVGTARYGINAAMGFGVPALNGFLVGAWMAVLLAGFRWWLALLVVGFWIVVRMLVHREAVAYLAVLGFQTSGSQRSVYFRDLGLRPAAAKEIRIFGLADWIVDRFGEHWSRSTRGEVAKRARIHVSLWLAVPIVALYALGFLLAVGEIRRGALDLRGFAVAIQALLGVSILGMSWRDEVVVTFGAATVPGVWELETMMASQVGAPGPSAQEEQPPAERIRCENVTFTYPGRTAPVLRQLDLDIPIGRSTALVGTNGAGKTTIIKLLCGLIEPASGRITIDGRPLGQLHPDEWRRHVAVLFQDFVHYPFSAADNVTFGAIDHRPVTGTLDRVAERAGLTEVVSALPSGWETPLNRQFAGGADLSGGQWQRVALARALWAIDAGATVLVLDEPTANLDVRAEARFYEQFLGLTHGLTTILVSHRFASVRQADQICVIDDGGVAEQGSHHELMGRDSLYASMFGAQTAIYRADA